MKIVGYSYFQGQPHFTMKCDACLLNNRKPMFRPDWSTDVRANDCLVVRISRLGKCIEERFASRYYDAIAPGIDFIAMDYIVLDYPRATAFDYSLCVGEFVPAQPKEEIDRVIAAISEVVTLRMGDLVYIDRASEPRMVERDEVIQQEGLYCKIK